MDNEYALAQWRQALRTAETAPDEKARANARRRLSSWSQVLEALRSGALKLGSRTPVSKLPAWVTLEVLRGGFATGKPVAGGDLSEFELAFAREAGIPEHRGEIFAHAVSDGGLQQLWSALDSGEYEVDVPESSALLTVAWLVRAGDPSSALTIVETIRPFSETLRFLPARARAVGRTPEATWLEDAGTVAETLREKQAPEQIERMNTVLSVWNPFADRLLAHWQGPVAEGRFKDFDPEWLEAGRALIAEFERLAAEHPVPRRHKNPKENAATLRLALTPAIEGNYLPEPEQLRVRRAVTAMLERRGAPGSPELTSLRETQRSQASIPAFAALAHLAAARLGQVPSDAGIPEPALFAGSVTPEESAASGIPVATPLPGSVTSALRRSTLGSLDELLEAGIFPSAEALAAQSPQITARVLGEGFTDPVLRELTSRTYLAFRRRRSLLLLNLERQVQPEEIPWFAAARKHADGATDSRELARASLLWLAGEVLSHWPGVSLPNSLITELGVLAKSAGIKVPLVEDLAVDIFEGRFSRKFTEAFLLTSPVLSGTLYARYYRLPPADVIYPEDPTSFTRLCFERSSFDHHWCPVCAGTVVEQEKILTSHNMAALVSLGVVPRVGWRVAAERAFELAAALVGRLHGTRVHPRTLKELARAWRQLVFCLSMLDSEEQAGVLAWARDAASAEGVAPTRERLLVLLDGLEKPEQHPMLLGWGHKKHWLLEVGC